MLFTFCNFLFFFIIYVKYKLFLINMQRNKHLNERFFAKLPGVFAFSAKYPMATLCLCLFIQLPTDGCKLYKPLVSRHCDKTVTPPKKSPPASLLYFVCFSLQRKISGMPWFNGKNYEYKNLSTSCNTLSNSLKLVFVSGRDPKKLFP